MAALLGILGWFKYYGFLAVNVDNLFHTLGSGPAVPLLQVTLPVGISFFTFMAISYVVDIYRRQLEPARAVDLAVYLSFFPHLVAGPIVRGGELLPQIRRARPRRDRLRPGRLAVVGRAVQEGRHLLATSTRPSSHPVFSAPHQHSALEILFAAYGFAVQIYADFSGYTDIAIGAGLFLGFRFPQNFDAPYTARNLQDFWRRWHMTLSRVAARLPVHPPRRRPRLAAGPWPANIMITMILGGLWHGAAWTFVAWGAIHGTGQVVGHLRR